MSIIPHRPLYSILDDASDSFPENTAIDFLGKAYSYKDLLEMANRAACGFRKLGVKKGVKVGLFLPNCPQFIIAYFGILKAGGTVVAFSPLYSTPEIAHQIKDSNTKIMVTLNLTALYPKIKNLPLEKIIVGKMDLPFPKNILFPLLKSKEIVQIEDSWKELLENDGIVDDPKIDPKNDIAALQYTGGTTGVSKGAELTHYNLYANAVQCRIWFNDLKDGEERMMAVLPFFHIFAMTTVMNLSILIAAKIILHPKFELINVLKDIQKKKPTLMSGVPTMYTAINNYVHLDKYDLSSLTACISGGASLPIEVKEKFEKLTGCNLVEGYGLTESSPVACANPLTGVNKSGSVGLPLPQTTIKIEDIENRGTFLGEGEKGEICISGPQVMKGYYNKPDETKEVFTSFSPAPFAESSISPLPLAESSISPLPLAESSISHPPLAGGVGGGVTSKISDVRCQMSDEGCSSLIIDDRQPITKKTPPPTPPASGGGDDRDASGGGESGGGVDVRGRAGFILKTGDIGYVDKDGYVFIVDRLKELIIAGGFNIYPRHVEEAIYKHEDVLEAAVIGIDDEYRGQTVKAYIALKKNKTLTKNELKEFLKSHLAKYQIPTDIEFRDELPKTMIGKISKKDLQ